MDVLTKKQRSYNMSRIKAGNTKPELILRKNLFEYGLRGYRLHTNLPGKPDIVFGPQKLVVFIDGCFWHKCPRCFIEPQTRKKFWLRKIGLNKKRDKEINKLLRKRGWKILRFWEHEIEKNASSVTKKIAKRLNRR